MLPSFCDRGSTCLQKSEDSCKQYRKWLAALADYSRQLIGGREGVRAAEAEYVQREEELGLFLKEADAFLAAQKHRTGRRKRDRCRCPSFLPSSIRSPMRRRGKQSWCLARLLMDAPVPSTLNVAPGSALCRQAAAMDTETPATQEGEAQEVKAEQTTNGTQTSTDGPDKDAAAKFKPGIKFKLAS